jgi:hypothetical protein
MGIEVEAFNERYLGLPTAIGRLTSGTFDHLGERIRSKLQGGSERLVSCAGREIFLKAVIQSIPLYNVLFLTIKEVMQTINLLYGEILVEQLT